MTGRIIQVDEAWPCCAYKYRVFVEDVDISDFDEVLETLRQFFGEAVYFHSFYDWRTTKKERTVFLAVKKQITK